MIIHCTCDHAEQDRLHGKHNRVGNLVKSDKDSPKYRCTVCQAVVGDGAVVKGAVSAKDGKK